MLICMVIFVQVPALDNPNFVGGTLWYYLAVTMHIVLSFLHVSAFMQWPRGFTNILEGFKIMTILAQVLNFITALTLFARAPPYGEIVYEEKVLKTWLMMEIILVGSLVFTNMIYVFFRTMERPKLTLSIEPTKDHDMDYLSCEDPQLLIA